MATMNEMKRSTVGCYLLILNSNYWVGVASGDEKIGDRSIAFLD
jgi:hypothetical protein